MFLLENVFDRLARKGSALRGAVAFTIDDGYVDQAEIAGRVFAHPLSSDNLCHNRLLDGHFVVLVGQDRTHILYDVAEIH